uniref:Uncharacterized protein n=1 Tax=Anguilla anguilla TaxID=7936 RepID=A0A0E9UK94_ANGAN
MCQIHLPSVWCGWFVSCSECCLISADAHR